MTRDLMTWKSAATAALSGAGVLATWIGVLAPPATSTREQTPAARAVPLQTPDIQRQAEHLQAHLHPAADYRPPARNPFRFVARSAPRRIAAPVPAVVAAAPIEPARPSIRVSGIATDVVNGVTLRTAVLSTAAGIVIAREGESSDGYTVQKIDDQSVEVTTPDGSTVTLPFSNPDSQLANPPTP